MRYHFGLGVGHVYTRRADSNALSEPLSEDSHLMDISDLEFEEAAGGASSGLGLDVEVANEDLDSGSEHSLDRYDSEGNTNWEEDNFDDEELGARVEMYGLDFLAN